MTNRALPASGLSKDRLENDLLDKKPLYSAAEPPPEPERRLFCAEAPLPQACPPHTDHPPPHTNTPTPTSPRIATPTPDTSPPSRHGSLPISSVRYIAARGWEHAESLGSAASGPDPGGDPSIRAVQFRGRSGLRRVSAPMPENPESTDTTNERD